MTSRTLIPVLVTMMLVTGVCNTILNKYQDLQCVRNCDSPDPKARKYFEQPVIQTYVLGTIGVLATRYYGSMVQERLTVDSVQMFIGEMGCWIVVLLSYVYRRLMASRRSAPLLAGGYRRVRNDDVDDTASIEDENPTVVDSDDPASKPLLATEDGRLHLRGWKVFYLAAPACCDLTATTLMNVGLLLVAASIYQMTRGAVVLFVGLFSVWFLHRRLYLYKWLGLFLVVLGVGLVGLAGALFGDDQGHGLPDGHVSAKGSVAPDALRAIVGVLLIAFAQIFTASQFVLEEWILERYAMDPLNVVGWEGIFGFLVTVTAQIILHLAIGRTESGRFGYFDAVGGWRQVVTNGRVALASIFIMISIGGFNFFGISVTRAVSATSRSTIDTSRTLFIWLVSLALGWETFKWLQVVGFAILVYGTFLFNDIVRPPLKACLPEMASRSRD